MFRQIEAWAHTVEVNRVAEPTYAELKAQIAALEAKLQRSNANHLPEAKSERTATLKVRQHLPIGPTFEELNAILADLKAKKQRGIVVNKPRRKKPFEEFWEELLNELKTSRKVRDWTSEQGYLGGTFEACSFRYLNQRMQNIVHRFAHFPCDPNECIVGKRIYGMGFWVVSEQDCRDCYHKWVSYSKPQGTTRKAFEGETGNSTYLIALFKEFEHLMH
jgi:hypothetical protein